MKILAARHAATMRHAMMQQASLINGNDEQAAHLEASDLGEKLEQAVHMALNEVVAILGFSLDPDDRAFASILKAKTTILSAVLNAQVRVDERRLVKEDTEHDLEMEKIFSESRPARNRPDEGARRSGIHPPKTRVEKTWTREKPPRRGRGGARKYRMPRSKK
jgi:hypothetical protein